MKSATVALLMSVETYVYWILALAGQALHKKFLTITQQCPRKRIYRLTAISLEASLYDNSNKVIGNYTNTHKMCLPMTGE